MAPKKLRLALVGCGRIAQVHWRGIEESAAELIHVVACIDIFEPRATQMAEKLAEATGEPCAAFTSLAAALASGAAIDAVDLMLLHNMHEAAALEAFEAGVHVLMEKPMSITPESCARIMRAAQATDKAFWIAEQARCHPCPATHRCAICFTLAGRRLQEQYNPAILTVQRLISEGAIGETITLHTMGGTGRPARHAGFRTAGSTAPKPPPRGQGGVIAEAGLPSDDLRIPLEGEEAFGSDRVKDKAWRADKTISGGGVIIDGGSHTIRPMRMMCVRLLPTAVLSWLLVLRVGCGRMEPHCGNIVAVAAVTENFEYV